MFDLDFIYHLRTFNLDKGQQYLILAGPSSFALELSSDHIASHNADATWRAQVLLPVPTVDRVQQRYRLAMPVLLSTPSKGDSNMTKLRTEFLTANQRRDVLLGRLLLSFRLERPLCLSCLDRYAAAANVLFPPYLSLITDRGRLGQG
ncbi:hypothetical protein HKX21_16370 [Sulfitobacter sp. KS8]|nr:hypothetical protein [Sulfitobacter sp. KS8]MDF3408937.1 hypothetical protein [Sulfitobacter sp. Ks39]